MAGHRRHGRNCIKRGHATRLAVSIDSLWAQLDRGALAHIDLNAPWLVLIDEAHHAIPNNFSAGCGVIRRVENFNLKR